MSQPKISKETKKYFNDLKRKIIRYNFVKKKAIQYVMDKKIKDETIISGCITIALLWQASKENEYLTEQSLLMYLGINSDREVNTTEIMHIDDSLKGMSLTEVLKYTVENF